MEGPNYNEWYVAGDPNRPFWWRHFRVLQLLDHPRGPLVLRKFDDADVRFFLARERELRAALAANRRPAKRLQPLIEAAAIFQGDSWTRAIVDARLLARESDEVISQKTGFSAAAIDFYERRFFNVRNCIEACDYITIEIDRVVDQPLTEDGELSQSALEAGLRQVGYAGGALVLDSLVYSYPTETHPASAEELPDWHIERSRRLLQFQLCELMKWQKLNSSTYFQMMRLALRDRQQQRVQQAARNQNPGVDYTPYVEAMLQSIPWHVMQPHDADACTATSTVDLNSGTDANGEPTSAEPQNMAEWLKREFKLAVDEAISNGTFEGQKPIPRPNLNASNFHTLSPGNGSSE